MRPISAVNLIDIFLSEILQNDAALPRRSRVAKPPIIRFYQILDYLEAYNVGNPLLVSPSLEIYQVTESIDYPRNAAGELQAIVHPQRQCRDYQPLSPGDPMFWTWDGTSISYQGKSTVFPIFSNEAAYYEKGIAMMFAQKKVLEIPPQLSTWEGEDDLQCTGYSCGR